MSNIRAVAVFSGPARARSVPEAAGALGRGLAQSGIKLVYGGGRIGLMGAMADAAIAAGGDVIGVIPDFLTRREKAHSEVSEMIVTGSMHSRKRRISSSPMRSSRSPAGSVPGRDDRDHHVAAAPAPRQTHSPLRRRGLRAAAACGH